MLPALRSSGHFAGILVLYKQTSYSQRDLFPGPFGARPVTCPSRGMGFHKLRLSMV